MVVRALPSSRAPLPALSLSLSLYIYIYIYRLLAVIGHACFSHVLQGRGLWIISFEIFESAPIDFHMKSKQHPKEILS